MQGALQVNIGKTSARQNAALVFPVLGCFVLYIICAFGQRRTPCINTRIQHERALNAIAKRVSRGPKPLRGCRAALCWGQGAKPLGFPQSTREHSMKKRSTQSRERVKGGTPLWGQGAKPLAESRGRASGASPSLQLLCVHGDGEADFVAEPVGGGIFDGDVVLVKGETAHH